MSTCNLSQYAASIVEMCCLCVTLLCFSVVCLVIIGTQAAVTHDRYLHDKPVGFKITRILTDDAQKVPGH